MKLVIVESPAKSKTFSHYLGEDHQVEASVGHICDLATKGKGGLGVDVDNNFKATYSISKDKTDIVKKLKNLAKKSEEVILATDPDREGEAIAYHLANFLNLPIDTTKRLEFHEITKESITKAIEEPRTIDMNLVHSQEARRIIDRIIGFKISTLINNRIKSKSAGRVQSSTLRMVSCACRNGAWQSQSTSPCVMENTLPLSDLTEAESQCWWTSSSDAILLS